MQLTRVTPRTIASSHHPLFLGRFADSQIDRGVSNLTEPDTFRMSDLPKGWIERTSRKREGVKYYYNETTKETTWTKPTIETSNKNTKLDNNQQESLDHSVSSNNGRPEWEEARTPEGKLYYKNHKKRITQWTKPDNFDEQLADHITKRSKSSELEQVRVRHILLKHQKSRNPKSWRNPDVEVERSKENAQDQIDEMLKHLTAVKTVKYNLNEFDPIFSQVAEKHSDCSSGKPGRGGDLGFFQRKSMQPSFENAAFLLKIGELSNVVDSDSGLHIILRIG